MVWVESGVMRTSKHNTKFGYIYGTVIQWNAALLNKACVCHFLSNVYFFIKW